MTISSQSTVERLTEEMLGRIRTAAWPVGSRVPGERVLMAEFGVSRLALREALAHLRALGVLDTTHGRGTTIRPVDASALGNLFPLLLTADPGLTVAQMFELRLPLEATAAALAADRRTDAEADELVALAARYRSEAEAGSESAMLTDMAFHQAVARASHNLLFPKALGAITGLIRDIQTTHLGAADLDPDTSSAVDGLHARYNRAIDCTREPVRRQRGIQAHASIAEAIQAHNAGWARAEMEAHLTYSARHATPWRAAPAADPVPGRT